MNTFTIPLQVQTLDELHGFMDQYSERVGFFEVWLDYLDEIDTEALQEIIAQHPGQLVFTTRRNELEEPQMDPEERLELLSMLAAQDCFIDLDVGTQAAELKHMTNEDVRAQLIASFHDYSATPENLEKIVADMDQYNPTIVKLAGFCEDSEDAVRLIELKQSLNEQGLQSIILGMGEHGKLARLACNQLGNKLVFVSISDDKATAPGQFTLDEAEQMQEIIGEVA